MAVLQNTTITGGLTMNGMSAGFMKISPTGIVTVDTNAYLTAITSGQVTGALGYTPYNSSNPNGYITSSALSSYLPLSGGTMTGTLAMHEGAYYGTITFGSSSYWRAGISMRDATNAELRIWAKGGAAGSIYFATGFDGESSATTLPADGMALKNNSLGIGGWAYNEFPSYKLHVKGDIYASAGWVRVAGSSGLYFESYGGGWRMTGSSYIESYGSKSLHMNGASVDYVGSLYFSGAGHIQPNAGSYGALQMTNAKNGWAGIRFTESEVNLMMNSNESGHYRNGYGWQFRWYNGAFYISTGSQGGGTEYTAIHSGNIGSQSVNYASSSGTSTNTYNIYYNGLGSGSMNISTGASGVYRNENGNGGNLNYAPVLHLAASDTMWQIQGDYYSSTDLRWRAGYAGNWYAWRQILHSANYQNYAVPLSGGTMSGNLKITPQSESWAEGLTFLMPNTTTWGGLRWQRQRGNSDGNWYIGFTALDSTDDLVFGANNAGSQIDNIIRLTKGGDVRIRRHFDATTAWTSGITSLFLGWYGGKVILGNNNNSGHDYASGLGSNTVVSTNPFYTDQSLTVDGAVNGSPYRAYLGYFTAGLYSNPYVGLKVTDVNSPSYYSFVSSNEISLYTGYGASAQFTPGQISFNSASCGGGNGGGYAYYSNSTASGYDGSSYGGDFNISFSQLRTWSNYYGEGLQCQAWDNANLYIGGTLYQNNWSDEKYKDNVLDIEDALGKINSIRGVEYDWNDLAFEETGREGHDVGVIAQEVQAVYPFAVREVDKERQDYVQTSLVVDYEKLIPLLVQSVKELSAEVDVLKIEVQTLKDRIDGSGI